MAQLVWSFIYLSIFWIYNIRIENIVLDRLYYFLVFYYMYTILSCFYSIISSWMSCGMLQFIYLFHLSVFFHFVLWYYYSIRYSAFLDVCIIHYHNHFFLTVWFTIGYPSTSWVSSKFTMVWLLLPCVYRHLLWSDSCFHNFDMSETKCSWVIFSSITDGRFKSLQIVTSNISYTCDNSASN